MQHSYEYIFQPNPSYERNPEVKEDWEATAQSDFKHDYCNEDPITGAYCSLLQNRGSSMKRSNSADDILEQSSGLKLPQYDMAILNTRWSLSSIEDEDSEPLSKHLPTPTGGDAEKRDTQEIPLSFDQTPEKVSKPPENIEDPDSSDQCNTQSKDREYYNLYYDDDYFNFSKSLPRQASSKQHRDRLVCSMPQRRQKKPIPLRRGQNDQVRQEEAGHSSLPPVTPRRNKELPKELPNLDWERIRQEAEERPSPPVTPRRAKIVTVKIEQLPMFDWEKVWQQEAENIPSPPVIPRRPRRSENEDSSGIAGGSQSLPVSPQGRKVQEKEGSVVAMLSPSITPRKLHPQSPHRK